MLFARLATSAAGGGARGGGSSADVDRPGWIMTRGPEQSRVSRFLGKAPRGNTTSDIEREMYSIYTRAMRKRVQSASGA